jgi:hypothetical protein
MLPVFQRLVLKVPWVSKAPLLTNWVGMLKWVSQNPSFKAGSLIPFKIEILPKRAKNWSFWAIFHK